MSSRMAVAVALAKVESRKRKIEQQLITTMDYFNDVCNEYDDAKKEFDKLFPEPKRLMKAAENAPITRAAESLSRETEFDATWQYMDALGWSCDDCGVTMPLYDSVVYPEVYLCVKCKEKDTVAHKKLADLVQAVLEEDDPPISETIEEDWAKLGEHVDDFKCSECKTAAATRWLCCSNHFNCEACYGKKFVQ